jgi:hypothetical protein
LSIAGSGRIKAPILAEPAMFLIAAVRKYFRPDRKVFETKPCSKLWRVSIADLERRIKIVAKNAKTGGLQDFRSEGELWK